MLIKDPVMKQGCLSFPIGVGGLGLGWSILRLVGGLVGW